MVPGVLAIQVTQPTVQLVPTAFSCCAASRPRLRRRWRSPISIVAALAVAATLTAQVPLPHRGPTPSEGVTGPLLRFSLPVSGMALIDAALLWIDTLLLGVFRTAPQVATYGLIARLMTLSLAAMLTVTAIFGPFVAQYVERRDRDALERTLRTATRWAVLIACPVILAIVLFGPRLLDALHQNGSDARPVIGSSPSRSSSTPSRGPWATCSPCRADRAQPA